MVGGVGGVVTSLAGVVGYFLPALSTVPSPDGADATIRVLVYFAGQSLVYHLAVLVLVPFLTTVVAVLVARRWGLDRSDELRLLGGIVTGPVLTVVVTAGIAVVTIGGTAGPTVALFALVLGIPVTVVVAAVVATAETAGALAGYVLLRSLQPVGRDRSAP